MYQQYIDYLNYFNIPIKLQEGYYWYDRGIIKAFDRRGNLFPVVRILVQDDLSLNFKLYNNKYFKIESWEDSYIRNKARLDILTQQSLNIVLSAKKNYPNHLPRILTSGGKDSSVTSYIVNKVIPDSLSIFNNTTLDCADTYLHIKQDPNVVILTPEEGFYNWRERRNFVGNRLARACCDIFKESATIQLLDKDEKYLFFMGMRNSESTNRQNYTDYWKNTKWGERDWIASLPIRHWTEEEIWLYIVGEHIPVNPKYYKGYGRVGCAIACPYYTKATWSLDKFWYPSMYNRWHNILTEDFIKNKKAPILNCTLDEYHLHWNGTGVREYATDEVIHDFACTQNIDYEVAKKYFNKRCACCNSRLKSLDVALSLKLYGRGISTFKCIKCIAKDFGVSVKELKEKANEYKEGGCSLF